MKKVRLTKEELLGQLMDDCEYIAIIGKIPEGEKFLVSNIFDICGFDIYNKPNSIKEYFYEKTGINVDWSDYENECWLDYKDGYIFYWGRVKTKYKSCCSFCSFGPLRSLVVGSFGSRYKASYCKDCFWSCSNIKMTDEFLNNYVYEDHIR